MNEENQPKPEEGNGTEENTQQTTEMSEPTPDLSETKNVSVEVEKIESEESVVAESSSESKPDDSDSEEHEPVPHSEEQFLEKKSKKIKDENHDDENDDHDEETDASDAVDITTLSREEQIDLLEKYVDEVEIPRFKSKIANIRELLSHTFQQEKDEMLSKFIDDGGIIDDFQPITNPFEDRFHKALKKFHKKRIEYQGRLERERQDNLASKKEILELLKDLIQNEDNMHKAFERFHELQAKWRSVGAVPSGDVQDLQMTYKFLIDKFYDYIKINRELQELDQRHNLDAKLILCEQAEALMLEQSLNVAFRKLHNLQDKWRETGPVPRDKKNEVWDRFKAACDSLFKNRSEYIKQLTEKRALNLEEKTKLCEAVEAFTTEENWKHKDWQEATAKIGEFQSAWRKIGPADKKVNDKIWARFRAAGDVFYKAKNEYYQKKKQEFAANMQQKTELCIQAEALQNSEDWKATTNELKRLQEEWKKTGHVGERNSEKIWKRFRSACDAFFKNKSNHFASQDKDFEENLIQKVALIELIENYDPGTDLGAAFEELKNFQRQWSDLGMVPLKKKDEINKRYKTAIDAQFDKVKVSSGDRKSFRGQQKSGGYVKQHSEETGKMDSERRSLVNKMAELKNDVQVWENNIGFFAKSKNAEKLKTEFEEKITTAKKEIATLKEKLDTSK